MYPLKILTAAQIREADAYTIKNEPIASVDLMERASEALCKWILSNMSTADAFIIFCGMGNNGGDGLALARMLAQKGKTVKVVVLAYFSKKSEDFIINEKRLQQCHSVDIHYLKENDVLPAIPAASVVIDAIFGSGLSKPVYGFTAAVIEHINKASATVLSVDVPSGLFCDSNKGNDGSVVAADVTLSFEFPKSAFLWPGYGRKAGQWHILPIGLHKDFVDKLPIKDFLLRTAFIKGFLKKRDKFSHKNTYGHALLVSGSYGKMGAAVLSSRACLRTGAGLLTAYVPQSGYSILQTTVPEAMLITDKHTNTVTDIPALSRYSAVGAGPGLGTEIETAKALHKLLTKTSQPLVLDADALNILASHRKLLELLPEATILTPHYKEFERLYDKKLNTDEERQEALVKFSKKNRCITVLKGAHTCIATPEGEKYYNASGNSGMATAGSGDVLTGIILSFLSQGYTPLQSALSAVYLHGLAADLAVAEKESQESLLAGDIIAFIGKAFKKLRN